VADQRDLEAQFAAIDDRLRELEAELDPDAAAEDQPPPRQRGRSGPLAALLQRASRQPPPGAALREVARELETLTELHHQVLDWIHELIAAYEAALARRPRAPGPELTMSAGPFATNEALEGFVAAIKTLPGVSQAAVRGFEGTDRAIIEVQLS
jgi:hypothetical protein